MINNTIVSNIKNHADKEGSEYSNFEEITWGMVKKLEKLYKK